jgi:F-type H+-transporting ATPase subunit b
MKNNNHRAKIGAALLVLLAATTLAAIACASSGEAGGSLSPAKLKDLLWRTLNFAILLVVLVNVLAKPVANGLRARQQGIREQFADLEERRAEADLAYQAYEEKLAAIDGEVSAIMKAAVAGGEAEKERIIAEANRAAEDIKRQAAMAIQHELAAAKLRLREEVAGQAVVMAEELIRKNLQEDDQEKIIENYLSRVGTVQ